MEENKSTELSRKFRARKVEAGESEIRGVYAKTELHKIIKDKLKKLVVKVSQK